MDHIGKLIEELLANESFLKYCSGDEKEKIFWEKQLQENPELSKKVYRASKLYQLVRAEMVDVRLEADQFRNFFKQHIVNNSASNKNQPKGFEISGRPKKWMRAAAAIVFLISVGGYFLWLNKTKQVVAKVEKKNEPLRKNDIAPGGNKAVLTLADGSQIILDSVQNGVLTTQGNIKVEKLNSGQLTYNGSNAPANEKVFYNTISTPKGGQYKVILSDGTEVWLNAASAIRYPAVFAGGERQVEISGEVYFEVTKNEKKPFIVKKTNNSATIKVLGTHFNVNAYDDESEIKVTLLQGAVKVTKGNLQDILKPGQQARMTDENIKIVNDVDIDQVMAWKNGGFDFGDKASIESIMRQLERWYDLEVEYRGKVIPQFWGSISRDVNASQVFKMLEATGGVRFKIEGKKVIVMP